MLRRSTPLCALLILSCAFSRADAAERGLDFADLMKVRKVFDPVLADDGSWLALEARPGRGDGEVIVRATQGRGEHRIERGQSPLVAADGAWVAALRLAPFADREAASAKEDGEAPPSGAVLLRTQDGRTWDFERVRAHAFSDDGAWYAVHFLADEDSTDADASDDATDEAAADSTGAEAAAPREPGTRLIVVRLADQSQLEFDHVQAFAFDPTSTWIALALSTEDGVDNRVQVQALDGAIAPVSLAARAAAAYPAMAWANESSTLAVLRADESTPGELEDAELLLASFGQEGMLGAERGVAVEAGWELPTKNDLRFSRDDARLFVGLRPAEEESTDEAGSAADGSSEDPAAEEAPFDPFDFDTILDGRGVDVWHWNDPRIKSNDKQTWKERQEHLFRAVVHLDADRLVRLASPELPDVAVVENASVALARTDAPWLEQTTWGGFYQDAHVVDLQSGAAQRVVERTEDTVSLAPGGNYVAYYRPDGHGTWWLYDVRAGTHRALVADTVFADEDHDYPRTAPDYGVGGWTSDDARLFVYDKYDVWSFDTATGRASSLTDGRGRREQRTYRIVDLDPDREGHAPGATLLLEGFDERTKSSSFWSVSLSTGELRELRADDKRYHVLAKAKDAPVLLYTEERYDEFPDLWTADLELRKARRLTDVNPQLRDFDLGKAELVQWRSADGIPLDGVLIKPAGYREGQRYPVLVYFYRFFSDRLHEFNDPQINHRPSFPVYAGDGYAVFLPDVRFELGEPGASATRCLVPGVQALVDMGVADPDAIALHGHSWSGYQTAFVITQSDAFACAVAGAPVSNMTSAYGGIRYGTGLARQFQYEQTQSRIGATLWERRDLYVENSPLFYADRIRTPLLIQFGDEDDAVPWTQGVELYLAMRRLDKPCVLLQYRGEPHHLKKYANKLDYSIRMKEFVDHFCKGAPAPQWWTDGEPYEGE